MGDPLEFSFVRSLVAGAAAGTAVDVILFPLDTIKTRSQAPNGFWKAGGFRGVYKGLGPVLIGSAPGAAIFFSTYESVKYLMPADRPTFGHMTAACAGEVAACLVRVPTETLKQRLQAGMHKGMVEAASTLLKNEGVRGLYTGYPVTVAREIPFALIQFPLWESLKTRFAYDEQGQKNDFAASLCGAASGALAAAVTTPLDVAKTRVMLGKDKHGVPYDHRVIATLARIHKDEGFRALLSGLFPRVKIIGMGGLIFFGAYEHMGSFLAARGL
ncbi:putative mitochondrial carrier C12B10.09 [Diplonema papillatum]|nr:putative mitochondrial carrier C12B10.09 [Diplonema papillatum]